jgi:hypothetical protein
MGRFNLRKPNDKEVKAQYQVKILNRFAAFENLDDDVDIHRAWKTLKSSATENLHYYELKQHQCSKL